VYKGKENLQSKQGSKGLKQERSFIPASISTSDSSSCLSAIQLRNSQTISLIDFGLLHSDVFVTLYSLSWLKLDKSKLTFIRQIFSHQNFV